MPPSPNAQKAHAFLVSAIRLSAEAHRLARPTLTKQQLDDLEKAISLLLKTKGRLSGVAEVA